jgi:hypothetical protein
MIKYVQKSKNLRNNIINVQKLMKKMNEKRMESFLRGPVSNSIRIEEVKGHF